MRIFYIILGVVLVVGGLPLFWTPIPVGAVMILVGAALIVSNSRMARDRLHRLRQRHPRLDGWMERSERYTPAPFARILHKTSANGGGARSSHSASPNRES